MFDAILKYFVQSPMNLASLGIFAGRKKRIGVTTFFVILTNSFSALAIERKIVSVLEPPLSKPPSSIIFGWEKL